jgi:hypothetical protein
MSALTGSQHFPSIQTQLQITVASSQNASELGLHYFEETAEMWVSLCLLTDY